MITSTPRNNSFKAKRGVGKKVGIFNKLFFHTYNNILQSFQKFKDRVSALRETNNSLNSSNNSLNLSIIPKERSEPKCPNNNSIIIVDTTKNEVISVLDDTTLFEKSVPQRNEQSKAIEDQKVEDTNQATGKDDDVQYVPEKIDIITICDDSVLPEKANEDEEDSSSSEEEESLEEGEIQKSGVHTKNSVVCIEDNDDSVVEISDDDEDENVWEKKKIPNFLSLHVEKVFI